MTGGIYPDEWPALAERIKTAAGWRCERCRHRHETATALRGCTTDCRLEFHPESREFSSMRRRRQRVLTVHHLDGLKHNLGWWNLPALCQVCHLVIQGRSQVHIITWYAHRPTLRREHWLRPFAYGLYLYLRAAGSRDFTASHYDHHYGPAIHRLRELGPELERTPGVAQRARHLANGAGQPVTSVASARFWRPKGMTI